MIQSASTAGASTSYRHEKTATEHVERFLRSLPQDPTDLLPLFVANGVKDEPSLRGMLRMAGWQRWIYGWVRARKLTELQYAMVVAGLTKVV